MMKCKSSAKSGLDLYKKLAEYFNYYNFERRHQSLDDQIPSDIYRKAA